jgi:hypothetical protein
MAKGGSTGALNVCAIRRFLMGKTRHQRRGTLILSRTPVLMFAVSGARESRRRQSAIRFG